MIPECGQVLAKSLPILSFSHFLNNSFDWFDLLFSDLKIFPSSKESRDSKKIFFFPHRMSQNN